MTRSISLAREPMLKPTIHAFVSDYEYYRKHGIIPSGWEELKPMRRSRCWSLRGLFERCRNSSTSKLKEMKYSMTNIVGASPEGSENVTMLLTLNIPDLPMRTWCPTPWCFEPISGVRIISFEADGLKLQRDGSELVSRQTTRTKPSATRWPRSRVKVRNYSSISSLEMPSPVSSRIVFRGDSVVERGFDGSEFTPGMGAFDKYMITEQQCLAFGVEPGLSDFGWLLPAITGLEWEVVSRASESTWEDCVDLYRAVTLSEDIMGGSAS